MYRTCYENGVAAYRFRSFDPFPLQAHISARKGGVSPAPWRSLNFSFSRGDERHRVQENFARFCAALGLDAAHPVRTRQVHGAAVSRVDWHDAGSQMRQCDALITDAVDLPLFLVFADCVPLVLYDPVRHVLGACHAGWKGTINGVASATLEAMQRAFGSRATDVHVGIGPSIGPESYQVGEEVVQKAVSKLSQGERLFRYRDGVGAKPYFDLWLANAGQLTVVGVPESQIEIAGIDTALHTDEFYSHRAENGNCGLFGMLAWLQAPEKALP